MRRPPDKKFDDYYSNLLCTSLREKRAQTFYLQGFSIYSVDPKYGGFGSAPKFPQPQNLQFLLTYHTFNHQKSALEMVEKTLKQMANGGIFDQIGFGFSRYSTDE